MFATSRCIRTACAASIVALFGLALGCGGDEDSTSAPAAAVTPAEQAPKKVVPPRPPAGKVSDQELPESFPRDIPLYPGAQSERSLGIPGGPTLAAFSSNDSPETILAFYLAELSSDGWTIDDEGGGRSALKASKGKRAVNVRVDEKPSGETAIAIVSTTR